MSSSFSALAIGKFNRNGPRSFRNERYVYAPTQHCEVLSFRSGVSDISVPPGYDDASLGLLEPRGRENDFSSRLREPFNYPVTRDPIPQERKTQKQHYYFTLISHAMHKEHLKLWHWFDKYLS